VNRYTITIRVGEGFRELVVDSTTVGDAQETVLQAHPGSIVVGARFDGVVGGTDSEGDDEDSDQE